MTTATPRQTTYGGVSIRALATVALVGVAMVALGSLGGGGSAAGAAGLATAIVVGFFALGAGFLVVISQMTPEVSMFLALMTYAFQAILIAAAFVVVDRSNVLSGDDSVLWFGGTVVVLTMAWIVAQMALAKRARILAYDLSDAPEPGVSHGSADGAR